MEAPRGLHFVVVVWGERYCDTFLHLSLPTQLSASNLLGLARPDRAVFRIFTSDADAGRIRQSATYAALARCIAVEIETFDARDIPQGNDKYHLMTRLQARALREAAAREVVVVFLSPDILVADGSFAALERLSHRPAVMIAAPRLRLESIAPELLRRNGVVEADAIVLPPRELVALAMKHLHPVTEAAFWGRKWFTVCPSTLYWQLGDDGMLARYFHLHPLLVDPARLAPDFFERMESTIDGDLLPSLQAAPEDIYVVTDSDEVLVFEISDDAIVHGLANRREDSTEIDLVNWVRFGANPLHRSFVQHRVWFHSGDASELARFAEIAASSDALVRRVLHDVELPPPPSPPQQQPHVPRKRGPVRKALHAFERTLRKSIWRRRPKLDQHAR
jgi:hypothetical protein